MKYTRFEDLPVWKTAIELAEGVFALVEDRAFDRKGDLRNQLQQASLSISNNIAEGFERGTTEELLTFIYIARGSAAETRSMLAFCECQSWCSHFQFQISDLKSASESVSRQLRAWADSLQNSSIKGQRHLNERSRAVDQQGRRAAAFWNKLEREHAARLAALSGSPAAGQAREGDG